MRRRNGEIKEEFSACTYYTHTHTRAHLYMNIFTFKPQSAFVAAHIHSQNTFERRSRSRMQQKGEEV